MPLPPGFQKVEAVSGGLPSGFEKVPPPDAPEEAKLGFAQRFGKDLFDRQKVAEEIMRATGEGEQSFGEGVLQVVGKVGFGGALDLIGEGLTSAARGVSAVVPDALEDKVVDSAKNAGMMFLDTAPGKMGLDAIKKGMGEWEKFKESNPRSARNIEAVVDIGLLAAPVKRSAKPTTGPTPLGRAADAVEGAQIKQTAAKRADFVDDLVRPKQTAGVKADQVARTSEEGILRSKVITPSPAEARIARVVETVPGVSPKKTLQGNYNAINEELGKEASKLLSTLEKSRVRISPSEIEKSLKLATDRLKQAPTLVGDAAKTSLRLVDEAKRLAAQNPPTSAGLLKTRQQFDRYVASQKPKVLDPTIENATSLATREVRQTLNSLIDAKNPVQGVRDSLSRQSSLYGAMDNIAPKAAQEYNNIVLRGWQNAMKVLPFRGEFNQLAATAFGVGGLGAAAQFAPFFTGLAGLGAATYVGGKLILSPTVKKGITALLRQMDDAARIATDPAMIKQLRLDRALLMELTKGAE